MISRGMKFFSLALGCALILSNASVSEAQFTLTIDAVNDTFAFTGTDTGTGSPNTIGGVPGSIVQFQGFNPALNIFFNQDFTSSFSVVGAPFSGNSIADLGFTPGSGGADGSALLRLEFDSLGEQTLAADGSLVSFASQTPENRLGLEALIGTTLNLVDGADFSPISVVAAPAAVPEPGSAALMAALLCPWLMARRRK